MWIWARWWPTRARWPRSAAAGCCRWSKLTATVWVQSKSPRRWSASIRGDTASPDVQWERCQGVLAQLPRRPALIHAANSAASLRGRCYAGDLVRPGIFLYGGAAGRPEPKPVAAFRARVLAVRSVASGETV